MPRPNNESSENSEPTSARRDTDAQEAKNPTLKSPKSTAPPQKKGIPEFRQPKYSSEHNGRHSQMRHLRTNITRSLFGIAVVILVIGLIYIFSVQGDKTKNVAVKEDVGEIATSFEKVVASGTARELMNFADGLSKDLMSQPIPNLLNRLKQKKQIGQRLEELHEDELSYLYGLREQLDSLILLDTLNLSLSLNDKNIRSELFETATRLVDHEDIKIARSAQLGLSVSALRDYMQNPSDENYQEFEQRVAANEENLMIDLPSVRGLQQIVILVDASERKDHVKQFKLLVGNILKKSSTLEIWSVGAGIHDQMILGNIDFREMNRQILSGDETAIKELGEIVDNIDASDNNVSAVPIAKVISLVESLQQIGKFELEKKYIDILRQTSLETEFVQNENLVADTLRDYEKRKALINQTFDLSGSRFDGSPIELEELQGKIVVILFYSASSSDSGDYLNRIVDLQYLSSQGVKWIICSAENEPNENLQKSIATANPKFIVVSKQSAPNYLEQCPISKVPFVLIIDRDQKVIDVNVYVDQLRIKLEKLLRG